MRWFTIDEFERNICISYSTDGKPIKIQIYKPVFDANCNILRMRLLSSSPWFGERDCDCEGRKAVGGKFDNTLDGEVRWRKPRGLGLFGVKILSCDADSYEIDVKCDECCSDDPNRQCPDVDEANGACCNPQGPDNVNWPEEWEEICEEDVSKTLCEAVGGTFSGPCSKCKEDGNDNCNIKKGACCVDSNDVSIKRCLDQRTKKHCEVTLNGEYQGDDTWCDEEANRNRGIEPNKLVKCPGLGACCSIKWTPIPIQQCTVVDYIKAGNKKAADVETTSCESEGECSEIEISIETKTIKCISQDYKDLLAGKIDSVKAVISIDLPEANCDDTTVTGKGNTQDIIALENYPNSYQPLFTINTKNPVIQNVLFSKVGGKIGDILVEKKDNIITGVYKAESQCAFTNKEDCTSKNGKFTEGQLCCKKYAPNNTDCEEKWCEQPIQAASLVYEAASINDVAIDTTINNQTGGPGTELKKLLSLVGINASPTCSCNSRARIMDQWGPDRCETEIEIILGWLKEEASKRKLPFVDMAGYILIRRAIHNARKNNKNS